MTPQFRYEALDGMRGIAAIGVLIFHLSILGIRVGDHGYLAVDFFFILSGFVLSHAYTDRLTTIQFGSFLRQRIIRIIPLSILGLLIGSSYFLLRYLTQHSSLYSLEDILLATVLNAALIPKPWTTSAPTDTIFPSNTPLWSLSLEMFVNILWFGLLYKARTITLVFIVVLSALFLIIFTAYENTADLGATWPTYCGGIARVMFGFFMGALLWRHRPKPVKGKIYTLVPIITLIATLMSPNWGVLFDLLAIMLLFPMIVLMASSSNFSPKISCLRFAGDISYPLYVIHVPILMYAVGIAKTIGIESSSIVALAVVIACIFASFILNRLYDRPLRRYLRQLIMSQ
jgi:peptidoglycan/LPS O-acetylase OafA/YrhL